MDFNSDNAPDIGDSDNMLLMKMASILKLWSIAESEREASRDLDSVAVGPFREATCNSGSVSLDGVACSSVCFTNTSGKSIGVKRGETGVTISIPNNSGKTFDVASFASELWVNNITDSDQVTVQYECGGELV